MSSENSNLRTKVNMLVQKGQLSEPNVRFSFTESLQWHCQVDIVLSGVPEYSHATAPTKAQAHEIALEAFKLPQLRVSRTVVPKGCWIINSDDDVLDITFNPPDGSIKIETVKNTSNIFSVMQRIAKCE